METILIIGAGAAGLMAAYELSKQNKKVIILEATDRLGGRIYTYTDSSFSTEIELGAEFIHGKLPLTLNLLKQAGIKYLPVKGKMFHLDKGKFKKQNDYSDHWNELLLKMKGLKIDMPLSDFLQHYFGDDKYKHLRQSVKGFAEGFDLADISKASTVSLYTEWSDEEEKSYRIDGGYGRLIAYLESECKKNGCVIYTNCCVKKINWNKNDVSIITLCSHYFKGEKILITVPLSVLQADKSDLNYIDFTPAIHTHLNASKKIGFGTVVKILLEFSEAFWQAEKKNIGFLLTGEQISTWWTQLPQDNCILTAWVGNSKAISFKNVPDEDILATALKSLALAFDKPVDVLKNKLVAYKVVNWTNMPYNSGGYSYNTTESKNAKNLLNQPIEETIFFAGEALYDGTLKGTVEAAFESGKKTALKILNFSHEA